MHADLMRAPGDRLGRHPGKFLARLAQHGVVRDRMFGAVDVAPDHRHFLVVARLAFLGDGALDRAAMGARHAFGQRPVDLGRVALPERFAEGRRRRRRPGDDQDARRIAVQPMHQPRLLLLAESEELEQPVDMPGDAAAALRGEPRRLVENQNRRILMNHKAFGEYPLIAIDLWTSGL